MLPKVFNNSFSEMIYLEGEVNKSPLNISKIKKQLKISGKQFNNYSQVSEKIRKYNKFDRSYLKEEKDHSKFVDSMMNKIVKIHPEKRISSAKIPKKNNNNEDLEMSKVFPFNYLQERNLESINIEKLETICKKSEGTYPDQSPHNKKDDSPKSTPVVKLKTTTHNNNNNTKTVITKSDFETIQNIQFSQSSDLEKERINNTIFTDHSKNENAVKSGSKTNKDLLMINPNLNPNHHANRSLQINQKNYQINTLIQETNESNYITQNHLTKISNNDKKAIPTIQSFQQQVTSQTSIFLNKNEHPTTESIIPTTNEPIQQELKIRMIDETPREMDSKQLSVNDSKEEKDLVFNTTLFKLPTFQTKKLDYSFPFLKEGYKNYKESNPSSKFTSNNNIIQPTAHYQSVLTTNNKKISFQKEIEQNPALNKLSYIHKATLKRRTYKLSFIPSIKKEKVKIYYKPRIENIDNLDLFTKMKNLHKTIQGQIKTIEQNNEEKTLMFLFRDRICDFYKNSKQIAYKTLCANPYFYDKKYKNENGLKTFYKFIDSDKVGYDYIKGLGSNYEKEYNFFELKEEALALLSVFNQIKVHTFENFSKLVNEISNEIFDYNEHKYIRKESQTQNNVLKDNLAYAQSVVEKFKKLAHFYENEALNFLENFKLRAYDYYTLHKNIINSKNYSNFLKEVTSLRKIYFIKIIDSDFNVKNLTSKFWEEYELIHKEIKVTTTQLEKI